MCVPDRVMYMHTRQDDMSPWQGDVHMYTTVWYVYLAGWCAYVVHDSMICVPGRVMCIRTWQYDMCTWQDDMHTYTTVWHMYLAGWVFTMQSDVHMYMSVTCVPGRVRVMCCVRRGCRGLAASSAMSAHDTPPSLEYCSSTGPSPWEGSLSMHPNLM